MATSNIFQFMKYMDENSINPNLICSVCHKPLMDPVSTPCDETCCRACIIHWLNQGNHNSCTICGKKRLEVKDFRQASRPLRNMLDQIPVQCKLCKQSNMQRGNFSDHINKSCAKAEGPCRAADLRCPWKGPRDEATNHASVCLFETLRPVLGTLIAENQQLTNKIEKHNEEINELKRQIAERNNRIGANDNANNTSSISQLVLDDDDEPRKDDKIEDNGVEVKKDEKEDEKNTIIVKNLPSTIRFHDLMPLFSKVGTIQLDEVSQKYKLFVRIDRIKNDDSRFALITYDDEKSAQAAISRYDLQHIPAWNTRIRVYLFDPMKKDANKNRTLPTRMQILDRSKQVDD